MVPVIGGAGLRTRGGCLGETDEGIAASLARFRVVTTMIVVRVRVERGALVEEAEVVYKFNLPDESRSVRRWPSLLKLIT